ncbi:uncharacterized protein ACBR49_015243 [Aulostomus maculatus]
MKFVIQDTTPVEVSSATTETAGLSTIADGDTTSKKSEQFSGSSDGLDVMSTINPAHSSTDAQATASETSKNLPETAKPTEPQQSASISTNMPASAPSSASWPQTTEHDIASLHSTPVSIQTHSSPSGSSTVTTNSASPAFDPKSPSSETFTASTELVSVDASTSQLPLRSSSTVEAPSSSAPAHAATTAGSTSSAGIFIPPGPKTTKSTPVTTKAPRETSKIPTSTGNHPCSTHSVVTQCLIAIASLGGLATVFIVSTIVLCTKLSTRKYKIKKSQPATEMMCISSLLPERNYNYTRQRAPVRNGILVMHSGGDSDEDVSDNLTLSSFLPDNDRYV